MPETVRQLAAEVDGLKAATLSLSTQVSNLSGALTTLNHMQEEQIALRQLAESAVQPEDIKQEVDNAALPVRADLKVTRRLTIGMAVVTLGVLAVSIFAFNSYVHYRKDTYQRCLDRNIQSKKINDLINQSFNNNPQLKHATPAQLAEAKRQAAIFKSAFPASPSCANLLFHWPWHDNN